MRWMTLGACLAFSVAGAPAASAGECQVGELDAEPAPEDAFVAPEFLPTDASGCPTARTYDSGTWLPAPLDDFVLARLAHYEVLARIVPQQLERAEQLAVARVAAARKEERAKAVGREADIRADAASLYSVWELTGGIAGGVAAGVVITVVVAVLSPGVAL